MLTGSNAFSARGSHTKARNNLTELTLVSLHYKIYSASDRRIKKQERRINQMNKLANNIITKISNLNDQNIISMLKPYKQDISNYNNWSNIILKTAASEFKKRKLSFN